jgi:hypothetical protein
MNVFARMLCSIHSPDTPASTMLRCPYGARVPLVTRLQVPLPPSAVVGPGRPQGKAILQHQRRRAGVHASSSSGGSSGGGANSSSGGVSAGPVDMYALMTYRPLTVPEAVRWSNAWTDAAVQPRKKPPPVGAVAASASSPSLQVLIAAQQALPVRCVPHVGGIAQEVGLGGRGSGGGCLQRIC